MIYQENTEQGLTFLFVSEDYMRNASGMVDSKLTLISERIRTNQLETVNENSVGCGPHRSNKWYHIILEKDFVGFLCQK